MELPLAEELLHPGLQARPAVPQRELVGKVGLYIRRIAAVRQSGPGKFRPLLQAAVLHVGLLPVRQQHVPRQKASQEEAEHRRQKTAVCLCHVLFPP